MKLIPWQDIRRELLARALLVEFSDEQGQTHAMAVLLPDQLMALHRKIEAA